MCMSINVPSLQLVNMGGGGNLDSNITLFYHALITG